jgi:hypothetical protein
MPDKKSEHHVDTGKVAEDSEKAPEAGQKGQRTQGGHQETQPSQSSEKVKNGP